MKYVLLLLVVGIVPGRVESARILGLFDYPGKSHFIMFEQVMKALAQRGHDVTVYSHFPQEKPVTNYKDISLVGSLPPIEDTISMDDTSDKNDIFMTIDILRRLSAANCDKIMQFPAMQELMQSNEKYDLIFTEAFIVDCMLPFVHKFQAPNIALRSSAVMPWTPDRFGLPDNPSYIPIEYSTSSDHMGFVERLQNALFMVLSKWYHKKYVDEPTNEIVKKYFGNDLPPLERIAKNTSMLFMNTNPVLNPPRPLVPAVVEIGGIHLQPAKELPKEIQKFMDEGEQGVIYFSFGSLVRAQDLSEEKRKAILEAFSELPQRVLWKWEAETLPGQPPNVLVRKWLPQLDILSHPNTRLFITHGGLMGTIEAISNGVPLLGIPLFADQFVNVKTCVRRGVAQHLTFTEISKKSLLAGIHAVLNDPGYKERAEKLSVAYKDSPMPPRDAVVYWSEYVIRHKGAPHLRSAAVDMEWYQLLLLDVIAVVLLVCLTVVVAVLLMLRVVLRKIGLLKGSAPPRATRTKGKKNKQQ